MNTTPAKSPSTAIKLQTRCEHPKNSDITLPESFHSLFGNIPVEPVFFVAKKKSIMLKKMSDEAWKGYS